MNLHTFVICAYKTSPYLEQCICSLKGQTVKSEILVATSTPNGHIKRLAEKYGLPLCVNGGPGGITQDWNFAYGLAKTSYVTIVHQDDVYDPLYLERALCALKKAEQPLIFFSDYYEIRNGKKVTANQLLRVKRLMLLPFRVKLLQRSVWVRRRILSFGSPICCPSVTYAFLNLPYPVFYNHYRACEDWEAWERISKLKGSFLYDAEMLMGHRIHEGSETSAVIGENGRSGEEYEMFRKFWPSGIAGLLCRLYARGQKSNTL